MIPKLLNISLVVIPPLITILKMEIIVQKMEKILMWIKVSGEMILFGEGGVVRMKNLGQWDESRKNGYSTELFNMNKSVCYVKETIDQIEKLLVDNKKD
jgi:hypothetical protein